ncbi:MAG: ABC transporter substrate-binding protein, partial [Oscillospiraceae bacterium]|nr:ABC transporter substrate-binding protein [Oscillospiraceae bacterium]
MRLLSIAAAVCLVSQTALPVISSAEPEHTKPVLTDIEPEAEMLYVEQETYSDYYDTYINDPRPDKEILIQGTSFLMKENSDGEGISVGSCGSDYGLENKDNVLIWNAADGRISYEVDVPETGSYCLEFSYLPIPSNMANIEFSIEIDGKVPYDTASRATLNKVYVNDGDITLDSRGNQVRPSQKQTGMWMLKPLMDVDGLFNEPLQFHFEKGKHEISFDINKGYFALEYFRLYNPEGLTDYTSYKNSIQTSVTPESTPSTLIRIEGENAAYKSDSTLYPTADNSSYLASPSNPSKTVYNTIGSGNWKQALQTVTWIVPAEELQGDGWYKIGIKARQNEMRGFYSNRRVYIDGEVPGEELNQVKFYYDTNWQTVMPTDANG